MKLSKSEASYLEERNNRTEHRLEYISGASFEFSQNHLELNGTDIELELAKMTIEVTLSQKKGGSMNVNFDKFNNHPDVTKFHVKEKSVGFLCGSKGKTLREFEHQFDTFMFFDNDNVRDGKKTLYIMGSRTARHDALDECKAALRTKDNMDRKRNNKNGGGGGGGVGGGGGGGNGRSRKGGKGRRRDRDR